MGSKAKESPRKSSPLQLDSVTRRLIAGVVASALVLLIFLVSRSPTTSGSEQKPSLRGSGGAGTSAFVPPRPYRYDSFMQWLRTTDFSKSKFKWQPEVQEFDIDAAAKGKFAQWLEPSEETAKAIAVTKGINKYIFMDEIMRSGDLTTIGGPGTHLYVLKQLLPAAARSKRPTFIDAGCGPGVLLLAWVLAAGPGSQAIGLELDSQVVEAARRHLSDGDAYDTSLFSRASDTRLEVYTGNALNPDLKQVGVEAGTVDAINVGIAVEGPNELLLLASLLREGGLLIAPVCSRSIKAGESSINRCAGDLQVFMKGQNGSLKRRAGDPDIAVNFIVGHHDR